MAGFGCPPRCPRLTAGTLIRQLDEEPALVRVPVVVLSGVSDIDTSAPEVADL
jgi:hypothetical protein